MASLPHTTTGLASETPSTSETATGGTAGGNLAPKDSNLAADVSSTESKVGVTSNQGKDTTSNAPGSAEAAAEKLYEERIEEEYAKREGGA
ncbi:hypothetical protein LTR78_007841 [Recurvomyces mirabilis]|uniref:Uncharacterized protein n=1 Tax=Recurvomyces mirabilis TaxID=574656 RepID=A0AAE0WJ70_9PEZI|nr:hypothetical protein LTR78_007841 [Recurvomyces mirabilis]KAK5160117.1 hypothetical protein LTS14_002224 [Recurvomyces mirabilis]